VALPAWHNASGMAHVHYQGLHPSLAPAHLAQPVW
jgi:hypothetical protein